MVSLAALRNSKTPEESVKLMAGSRTDYSARLSATRASRGKTRVALAAATTTSTSEAPPLTTARPRVLVVKKATPTTVKAKPKAQAAPAPASKPAAPKPASSSPPPAGSPRPMPPAGGSSNSEQGKASWYEASYHESNPWICAHKTIAKGIVLTVTNLNTGASITCEVGDRGPYVQGRILDLSKYAFSRLASTSSGVIPVKITW
ncbi:MAG TPA: septal ring lytic transglycosylase RlpA family protein [Acidimicrobiales bacterium]|nr:septal ring lytic transglycosylase RlpA family protein [Acidimicrobiales bacterium]